MNYRDYKIFAPNNYYHVFNRGNGKQNIFLDESDFKFFLFRLKECLFPEMTLPLMTVIKGNTHTPYVRKSLPKESFDLLAYCLMPNHYHFLIKQNTTLPITKLISKVCISYSKYFNAKYERFGHVFQAKFMAVLVESDEYLKWLSAYIHNNPKIANLVKDLKNYPWSSYLDYTNNRNGVLCKKEFILSQFKGSEDYKKFSDNACEITKQRKDIEFLLLD